MDNRVAYFAGCFANFVAPEIGRAVVEVLRQNGIAVTFPAQRCCGTPWLSQGLVGEVRQRAVANARSLSRTGGAIVTACTTCALALKREYPAWLGTAEAEDIAGRTYDVFEYLEGLRTQGRLKPAFQPVAGSVLYHAPCHLKVWGAGPIEQRLGLLNAIPGLSVRQIARGCCGLAGTWGSKRQHYTMSMRIGRPLFEEIERQQPDQVATDCPTCQMQLQHGTGREVVHPIVLVAQAYRRRI